MIRTWSPAAISGRMNTRVKSIIATVLIHAVLGYVLIFGLQTSFTRHIMEAMTLVNVAPERRPPPPDETPPQKTAVAPKVTTTPPQPVPEAPATPALQDWASMSPFGRVLAVVKWQKYVTDTIKEEDDRFAKWRAGVPQGTGGATVARLRPDNLPTHTLYWPPAASGPLPIIAWGNGYDGCSNNSLPYAAFLGEIASHGYFVVAVGNDDLDYPYLRGEKFPDGRLVRVEAKALRAGVDWAVAENSRPGSPYEGKLDTSKIAYMGHGCGGGHAVTAGTADSRTKTIMLLNSSSGFRRAGSGDFKAPFIQLDGDQDEFGIISAGDGSFTRAIAAEWPMYRATLANTGRLSAYSAPDQRWTKTVVAWLDWQLKGREEASAMFPNCGWVCGTRDGWDRKATSLPTEG